MRLFPDDPIEFDSTGERAFDLLLCDGVDAYLDRLGQELLAAPVDDTLPSMPPSLVRHLDAIVARQRREIGLKKWAARVGRTARRAAVYIAIIGGVFLAAYMNVEAVRTTVNNFLTSITEDYVGFRAKPSQAIPSASTSCLPEFIPEGFIATPMQTDDGSTAIQYVSRDSRFVYRQLPVCGTNYRISRDDSTQTIFINEMEGRLSSIDGNCYLTWYSDTTIYSISGTINSELAVQIAESVYPK